MVHNPQQTTSVTPFMAAYYKLSENDRQRIKISVCTICEISKKTFYEWLKKPDLISKSNRFHIANLFGIDSSELFNPKTK